MCGVGGCLKLKQGHALYFWMGVGYGLNTKAELLALWCLPWFAKNNIGSFQVLGDSMIIIDYADENCELHVIAIDHWINRVRDQINIVTFISFSHVYCEFDQKADYLSKEAIFQMDG